MQHLEGLGRRECDVPGHAQVPAGWTRSRCCCTTISVADRQMELRRLFPRRFPACREIRSQLASRADGPADSLAADKRSDVEHVAAFVFAFAAKAMPAITRQRYNELPKREASAAHDFARNFSPLLVAQEIASVQVWCI